MNKDLYFMNFMFFLQYVYLCFSPFLFCILKYILNIAIFFKDPKQCLEKLTFFTAVSAKLNVTNYLEWAERMESFLQAAECCHIVNVDSKLLSKALSTTSQSDQLTIEDHCK